MIKLHRTRDANVVHRKFRGQELIDLSYELLVNQRASKQAGTDKHDFKSSIWGKAKKQLLTETHHKCAYCETPVAVVSYGDVEHYRPKSKYWWQAYCLDNYLASCAICNQKFKSNQFPYRGRKFPAPRVTRRNTDRTLQRWAQTLAPDPLDTNAVDQFEQTHDDEEASLINPYIEDPADYFAWRADYIAEEVELIPIPNSPESLRRVNAAKNYYGLNRPQLRRIRFFTFRSYLSSKLTLDDPNITQDTRDHHESEVLRMLEDDFPYSGISNFFERIGSVRDWIRQGYLKV